MGKILKFRALDCFAAPCTVRYRAALAMTVAFCVSTLLSATAFCAAPKAQGVLERLETNGQRNVSLPNIKKGRLDSGFKYYILPDHDIPIAKAVVYIKGGSIYDPSGKSGLAAVVADLARSGGTLRMSPDEVDRYADALASSISISAGKEAITASIVCQSGDLERSLRLLLDMFFEPAFDKQRFELLKKQFKDSVKRRPDDPDVLALVGFTSLLYGRDNPWGAYPTQASIDSISLDDVRAYHKRYFHPNNMIIGVSGDIGQGDVLRILRSYEHTPAGKAPEVVVPKAEPRPVAGIHVIEKEANQVVFNAGHQGSTRSNPDKYAIVVMNDMLGGSGSFKKRLPALIRVEKGLAYTVWSAYEFGPQEAPGTFRVFLTTKTPSAGEALELLLTEIEKFREGSDITEAELANSKKSILNKLVFEYASAHDIISNVVRFNYFGYPDNYIEEYGEKIAEVTLDDVRRVAKTYLHPENMQEVLVGEKGALEEEFKDIAEVKDLKIDE